MPAEPSYAKRPRDITLKHVPADIVNALAAEAKVERRSLSGHILYILEQHTHAQVTPAKADGREASSGH